MQHTCRVQSHDGKQPVLCPLPAKRHLLLLQVQPCSPILINLEPKELQQAGTKVPDTDLLLLTVMLQLRELHQLTRSVEAQADCMVVREVCVGKGRANWFLSQSGFSYLAGLGKSGAPEFLNCCLLWPLRITSG